MLLIYSYVFLKLTIVKSSQLFFFLDLFNENKN